MVKSDMDMKKYLKNKRINTLLYFKIRDSVRTDGRG